MTNSLEEVRNICSIRNVNPSELIKQDKVPEEYISNLEKLKQSSQYNILLEGARLGLTAYQKPKEGIPTEDLSLELQEFLSNIWAEISAPSSDSRAFGQVRYDKVKNLLLFYSADDVELQQPIGIVDISKFPRGPKGPKGDKGEKGEQGETGPGVTQEILDQLAGAVEDAHNANVTAQEVAEEAREALAIVQDLIPHEVMEKQDYDNLQDKDEDTLYLIYEDDIT